MSYNLTGAAYGGNVTLSNPALVATNAAATYSASTFSYAIKGELFTSGALAAAAPATDAKTGKAFVPLVAGESCLFAFFIDKAQAVKVVQSKKVSTLDFQGGLAAIEFPQMDDTLTPYGYITAQGSAALVGNWTLGSSNNTGVTGMTVTAHSVMDYPAQPIVTA
jgi:hypothetical protein